MASLGADFNAASSNPVRNNPDPEQEASDTLLQDIDQGDLTH
jgi:hypothetical protein